MKRKRGFYYFSKDEVNPKKRMKFEDDITKIPFLEVKKLDDSTEIDVFDQKNKEFEKVQKKDLNSEKHVILPNEFKKYDVIESFFYSKDEEEKIEKKIGFSKCNTDKDVLKTFGIRKEAFKKWKYDFSKVKDSEEELKKIVEAIKKDFKERKKYDFGGDECGSRSFIDAVLFKSLDGVECKIKTGTKIEGKYNHGPLDYVLFKDGVVAIVIEAKQKDISQGINQCLHQLKALHEQNENARNKKDVYYGFCATDAFWVPIKYDTKNKGEWEDKINIGEKYGVIVDDDLKKVVYMLRMIMDE